MSRRPAILLAASVFGLFLILLVWRIGPTKQVSAPPGATGLRPPAERSSSSSSPGSSGPGSSGPDSSGPDSSGHGASSDSGSTIIHAHNLLLRKGPNFRIYVRWVRGEMTRARAAVNPSFDDLDSFFLDVKTGVISAKMEDLTKFLNDGAAEKSPLKNITLSGDGNQIRLSGTVHKIIPLPVELIGTLSAVPDNRIQVHVTKLNVLKVPFKALLGGMHVTIADLFHPDGVAGIQVSGNDIFLDTRKLLPPPHIRGQLTSVRIVNSNIEEIYGNAADDLTRVEQWRNFLRLRNGTIEFGKLTMHHVDLMMIDISNDAWFDLDLAHYQDQLVNGYTRMTPQAGLQIFMPDVDEIPRNKSNPSVSIEWMKNRNAAPPPEVISK